MTDMELGQRMQKLRENAGLTQRKLAERLVGLKRSTRVE
jgi:transcriptional regulator with XRE-family HTH domain